MSCRKCQGITSKGVQCTRYASCRVGCKYYCWQHANNYVPKVGCPKKKSSKKKTSRKNSDKSSRQKGILKPSRSKSKTKKSVRFKPKKSLTEVYPIPARKKKTGRAKKTGRDKKK